MGNTHGETTRKFLLHLIENGPQTTQQLKKMPFWGGVRTRIPQLIKQGRVVRIKIANPDTDERFTRIIATAYKFVDGASVEPLKPKKRTSGETKTDREKREKRERAIAKAIRLLESHGYSVTGVTQCKH